MSCKPQGHHALHLIMATACPLLTKSIAGMQRPTTRCSSGTLPPM